MEVASPAFEAKAAAALADAKLQKALGQLKVGFVGRRAAAAARLPEFAALCDRAREIKDHTLDRLDHYLDRFERKVIESGGSVHWCRDAAEARATVLSLCRAAGVRSVTKAKSMIAEEIGLNEFLEAEGIEPVETDLGEYIIQLRHEPPSHLIAPAIHVNREEVADAFRAAHAGLPAERPLDRAPDLLAEARAVLRAKFLAADAGITGANFLIAETGSVVTVTNEGNADLTQTLPPLHIVIASLEKVVPTLEDATTILRVLARSATGQELSVYTTFATGPRRAEDPDGPAAFHVILLDNGRSRTLGSEFRDILRCIRCGACLNHCPVYGAVGGHAYGWVYSGPMGAVLTPALVGIAQTRHLPAASSFCGRCEAVCPMRIPLPGLMRRWRQRAFERRLGSPVGRWALAAWSFLARRPTLYHFVCGTIVRGLARLGRRRGRFRRLPLAGGWTAARDLPAPEGRSFQSLWAARDRGRAA